MTTSARARPVAWAMSLEAALSGCALSGCALSGCILADKDIEIEDEKISNRTPVRLVEPVVLSDEAELACDANLEDMRVVTCPQPATDPRDALPHYLDPNYIITSDDSPSRPWYFCSCAPGQRDDRALSYTLYVEDQDEKPKTRDPRDPLYGALFLDLPPRTDAPDKYVDYPRNLNPLAPLDLAQDIDYRPLYRRDPHLRQLVLGDTDVPLDLCNGGRTVLAPGLHTLTVMVTDRPWFKGDLDIPQVGMPDLASGATFDTITYIFYCHVDSGDDSDDSTKNCTCLDSDEVGA